MSKGEITADEFNKALMDLGMTDVAKQAATSTSTIEGAMGNLEAAVTGGLTDAFNLFKPAVTGGINAASAAVTSLATTGVQGLQTFFGQVKDTGAFTSLQSAAQSVGGGLQSLWTGIMAVVNAMTGGQPAGTSFGNVLIAVATAAQTVGGWLKTAGDWISRNTDLVTPLVAPSAERGSRHRRHHRHADCRRRSGSAQRCHGREPDHAGHHAHRRARGRTHLLLRLHQYRQGRVVEFHGFPVRLRAGHHRLLLRSRLHHRRIFNAAANGARNAWNGVVGWFRGLPGSIAGFFGNAGSILYNAGASIISGFLNGLKSMWSNVTGWISGIGDWIKAHKGPISYDRRLLIPAGQAIMTGFAQGLNTGFDSHVETAIARANRRLAAMPLNLSAQGNTATPAVVNTWNVEINGEVIDKDGTAKAIRRLLADYDARRS